MFFAELMIPSTLTTTTKYFLRLYFYTLILLLSMIKAFLNITSKFRLQNTETI